MTPTIVLLLAAVAASDRAAHRNRPPCPPRPASSSRWRTAISAALSSRPPRRAAPYAPRTVYRRGKAREWLDAAAFARLPAADRAAWTPMTIDEDTYQGLFYGSPLAYLLPLERLGGAGFGDLRGKRVADFGHGGIGQLRLFAELGAEAVGIDVDPLQPVLYAAPGTRGRSARRAGR